MMPPVIEAGSQDRMIADHINLGWYFKELFFTYKYGEKLKFRRAFDRLKPYLSDILVNLLEELFEESLWLNPITGKKGY